LGVALAEDDSSPSLSAELIAMIQSVSLQQLQTWASTLHYGMHHLGRLGEAAVNIESENPLIENRNNVRQEEFGALVLAATAEQLQEFLKVVAPLTRDSERVFAIRRTAK
jgi:hypothetical protein